MVLDCSGNIMRAYGIEMIYLKKMFKQYQDHKYINPEDYTISTFTQSERDFFDLFMGVQSCENLLDISCSHDDKMRSRVMLIEALGDLEKLLKQHIGKHNAKN